jgi:hypothetical protein
MKLFSSTEFKHVAEQARHPHYGFIFCTLYKENINSRVRLYLWKANICSAVLSWHIPTKRWTERQTTRHDITFWVHFLQFVQRMNKILGGLYLGGDNLKIHITQSEWDDMKRIYYFLNTFRKREWQYINLHISTRTVNFCHWFLKIPSQCYILIWLFLEY